MLYWKINEDENYYQLCVQRTGINLETGDINIDSSLEGRSFITTIHMLLEEISSFHHLSVFLAGRWNAARWLKHFYTSGHLSIHAYQILETIIYM